MCHCGILVYGCTVSQHIPRHWYNCPHWIDVQFTQGYMISEGVREHQYSVLCVNK